MPSQQLDDLLVLFGECAAACLLREVEVSVRDTAQQDRHAEEGPHRWVIRRESDRPGIRREVVEAKRRRVTDQDAEDPAATREVAYGFLRRVVDAGDYEALELLPAGVDDAEGGIACARQRSNRLDDALQDGVERKLGGNGDRRVQDRAQPLLFGLRHARGMVGGPQARIAGFGSGSIAWSARSISASGSAKSSSSPEKYAS